MEKTSNRGPLYCRKEMRGKALTQKTAVRCGICKMHIRGINHESGSHHQRALAKATE